MPFEAESADFIDPISDDEFANALEEQLNVQAAEPVAPLQVEPAAKMPTVEDFPAVAQQKLSPQQGTAAEENGPMGLLKRLATGLGGAAPEPHHAEPAKPAAKPVAAAPSQPAAPVREDNNPYAPPKNGSLDVHGRQAPAAKPISEDDQLDIPAFLRRQA